MAAKTPGWLVPLLSKLAPEARSTLWVGKPLLDLPAGWHCVLPDDPLPAEPYDCLCVGAMSGALVEGLGRFRAVCAPGAVVCLMLPEVAGGVGAKVARVFDPLGRSGRKSRPLPELCAALLALGASGVGVERDQGLLRAVYGALPAMPLSLDEVFVARHATS